MPYSFPVFPVDRSMGFKLYLTSRLLKSRFQRCIAEAGFDVTPEQYGVLSRLCECDGIHQTELADRAFKDRHNVTRIIQVLERKGYVDRHADEKDARLQRCYVTETGRRVHQRLMDVNIEHLRDSFRGVSDGDIEELERILSIILKNIEHDAR